MNEKKLLSIKEAAALFGIGQHRLREIVREDYDYRYHLMIGRIIRIKRQPFEKFIDQAIHGGIKGKDKQDTIRKLQVF